MQRVNWIKYTCPNRSLTENVFKRIFANYNPNSNPTHKNVFGKTK